MTPQLFDPVVFAIGRGASELGLATSRLAR